MIDPVMIFSFGVAAGALASYGGISFAKRKDGETVEHKVEIADLGENDILVLTNPAMLSDEVTSRLRALVDEKLSKGGRFSMVIGGGFTLSVIRRPGHIPPLPLPPRAPTIDSAAAPRGLRIPAGTRPKSPRGTS